MGVKERNQTSVESQLADETPMFEPFSDLFAGPIKCPHCESPVDSEAYHCPICSMSLAGAPWKKRHWSAAEVLIGTVTGIVLTALATWNALDPQITSAIKGLFADRD